MTAVTASQAEMQAPPGLELSGVALNSVAGASSADAGASSPAAEHDFLSDEEQADLAEALKEELVREVAEIVRVRIEEKTAGAIDNVWRKGQKAMQSLQQQQLAQTAQLQRQLEAFQEAHAQLEQENLLLRQGLEALMKNLTMTFGTPPPFPGPPPAPGSVSSSSSNSAAASAAAAAAAAAITVAQAQAQAANRRHTPPAAPVPETTVASGDGAAASTTAVGPVKVPIPQPLPTVDEDSETPSEPQAPPAIDSRPISPAPTSPAATMAVPFQLTLRRADGVPLGLDVQGDDTDKRLLVTNVRPGGAVEAWNRQCAGDSREIRPMDAILAINGAEDAQSMLKECLTQHLLKMTVLRGGAAIASGASASAPASTGQDSSWSGFRVDADEFIPSASSRS